MDYSKREKVCTLCKLSKKLIEFDSHCVGGKWYYRTYCTNCNNERNKKYNKGKGKSTVAKIRRAFHLKETYNITQIEFEKMLIEQDFKCAICKKETELSVDHNHSTGEVRELLCGNCNRALGLFEENRRIIQAAKEYLERWEHNDKNISEA